MAPVKAMDDIYFTLAGILPNSYQEVIEKDKQSQILLKQALAPKSEKEKQQILTTAQQALDNGANINVQHIGRDYNCLHHAVANNFLELVQLLIKNGITINGAGNYHGHTALHLAINRNNPIIAEILINAGARIDLSNKDGQTAFHWAVIDDNLKIAKLLIAHKANVNVRDQDDKTPLYYALFSSKEMVELLIDAGADINAQREYNGYTLLHSAANEKTRKYNNKLLIEAGADPMLLNNTAQTPAQITSCPILKAYLAAAESEYQWHVNNTRCITGPNTSDNKSSFLLRAYLGAAPIKATINNNTYLIDLYTIYKTYCENNKLDELEKLLQQCNFGKFLNKQKTALENIGLPLKKDQLHLQSNLVKQTTIKNTFSDVVIFTKKQNIKESYENFN
jgi:ankyrin repeat protein